MGREKNKVRIVDASSNNLRYLSSVLQANGYNTLEAPDGKTGLKHVAKVMPDLILLDYNARH